MIRKSLIPAAVVVLAVLTAIFIDNYPFEAKEVSRIQEMLYDKYKTSFVYERRESTDISDERVTSFYRTGLISGKSVVLYYFHPEDNDELSFYTIHGTGVTSMVFSIKEYCYDSFKKTLFDKAMNGKEFICTKENRDELADSIFGVQTELIDVAKNYNMSEDDILRPEQKSEFEIVYRGEIHKTEFNEHDKYEISDKLETMVRDYDIFLKLISTAGEDGSPSVWKADDCLCTECGEEAEYTFEFYRDGTHLLRVECKNCGSYIRESGEFEIRNISFVNVNDNGFSVMTEIKEIQHFTADKDGNNTCIFMKNIANYSRNDIIRLYGNVAKKDTEKTGFKNSPVSTPETYSELS